MTEKQAVQLIAIDMDGTLLNSQKEIPGDNIEAIQEATKAGIQIVLCSGRPRSGILPYFEQLGLTEEEFIIMNNGCTTYETKNWELIQKEELTPDEIKSLQAVCQDFPGVYLTLTGEDSYYVIADQVPELVAYDAGTVFMEAKARSLEEVFAEGEVIFQAMYMAEQKTLDAFQAAVDPDLSLEFSTVRSQDYIYEIMPQGATKASALEHLAQTLGLTASQVMTLGDAANDLEMHAYAEHSVAMGNASQAIKDACRYVTLSNDQAGVAYAIRRRALGEND